MRWDGDPGGEKFGFVDQLSAPTDLSAEEVGAHGVPGVLGNPRHAVDDG
jgi:hypothetical protein